jgi:hypothetical protein
MSRLLHFGDIVAMDAYLYPDKVGARDLGRALTFRDWNDRSCKLANALLGLGLEKGDRIAVLAYNCLEWMEIYAAVAKAGLVIVPINFRLVGPEVRYIVENSEAKAVIAQDDLLDRLETTRAERLIAEDKHIHFGGKTPAGYRSYEDVIAAGARSEPSIETGPHDPYREFPPFSSTSSSVPCNISVGKAAEGRSGKGQPPILAAATRNTERRRMRAPQLGLQRPSTRSECCSSKRGRWCRLLTPPGGAFIPRGRWRARR